MIHGIEGKSVLKAFAGLAFGLAALASAGCGGGESGPTTQSKTDLVISIKTPGDGAQGVSVSAPELVATFNRPLTAPDAMVIRVYEDTPSLFVDGKVYYGTRRYSATNLDLVYKPFNILQSRRTYTFEVKAEGAEASVTFTTEAANEGALPPMADRTYDFRLKELTYPKELADVFNAQLRSAPPLLMHVVELAPKAGETGKGEVVVVASTGKAGDPMGMSRVLPEGEGHLTTTSVALEGAVEGTWLGAGPSDLHTTASGVPLVIREMYVTGLVAPDANGIGSVTITGVIDPKELGKALELELDFICVDFRQYCDEDNRLRVAATAETAINGAHPFTTFITKPVNASSGVDPSTPIEVYFSEEVDPAATTVKVTGPNGAEVPVTVDIQKKSGTIRANAPMAGATRYQVEVRGAARSGGTDVRHLVFTTR